MDINNFDIRLENIRVFTNGDKITIQELTEDPRSEYLVDKDVTPGVYKYVWKCKTLEDNTK